MRSVMMYFLVSLRCHRTRVASGGAERKVRDTRRERRGTVEGKQTALALLDTETPQLLLAHITRIWRWGRRSEVKLKENCSPQQHEPEKTNL